jgi:DNA-binding MarR family transcriptional regulator
MSQDDAGIDLETSLGYLLKEAASALRAAMEDVLRPLDMTITHYSCLELLAQRPGSSNSDLARGAFVTRQSMNVLLQTLERDGFVTRPSEAPVGKVLPTKLTPRGRRSLEQATAAVRSVEVRMLSGLSDADRAAALRILRSMVSSLRADPTADPDDTDPDATDPDAADADAGSTVADGGGESARGD